MKRTMKRIMKRTMIKRQILKRKAARRPSKKLTSRKIKRGGAPYYKTLDGSMPQFDKDPDLNANDRMDRP